MASERFFRIEMLPALHGDCLFVEYGDAARTRRMLIDGGPIATYKHLEARLDALPPDAPRVLLSTGKLVGEGTSDELLDMVSGNEQYSIRLRGGDGTLKKLEDLRGVHNLVSSKEGSELTCTLTAEKGTDLREQIFDTAVASGAKLLELSHRSTSLEDVFLSLTGTTGRRGASADAEGGSDNE